MSNWKNLPTKKPYLTVPISLWKNCSAYKFVKDLINW